MKIRKLKPMLYSLLSLFFLAGCNTEAGVTTPSSETDEKEPASASFTEDSLTENAADEELPFQITEINLTVPGLMKDYTFLFLSDTHMIKLDGTESEQITENALPRTELFKDGEGISSAERFPEWVDYANETQVDMVFFGGDIIDFPSETNLNLLEENIDRLKMPYVFTLGNHDWTYPWDYMTPEGYAAYRPLFNGLTEENPTASVTEYEELVILSVDDSSNQINPEALGAVDEALSSGKPVIVIAHVPFSTETLLEEAQKVWSSPVSIGMADKGGIFPDANTLLFQEKILAEDSPVFCVLSGHVHFADVAKLTDSVTQIVSGAGYMGNGVLLRISGS